MNSSSKLLKSKTTKAKVRMLDVLVETPSVWHYGYGLAKKADVSLNTVYKLIDDLTVDELIEQRWESEQDQSNERRGADRHLFKLTEEGTRIARAILEVSRVKKSLNDIRNGGWNKDAITAFSGE